MKTIDVTTHLRTVAKLYFNQEDTNKATIFNTAALNIDTQYPIDLPETINDITKIRGIGPSTLREVTQFMETGTSVRLTELQKVPAVTQEDFSSSLDKLKDLLKSKNTV